MRRAVVQCGLVLLAMWVSAYAQSAGGLRPSAGKSDRPQCTDLSRQFVQPCPKRPPERAVPGAGQSFTFERSLPSNLFHTQKTFWTSPVRWRVSDLNWAVPFAGISAALIAGDTEIERNLPTRPSLIRRSNDLGNYGAVAFGGVVAGTYLWGKLRSNDRLSETAWMAGEAVANSFATTFVLKAATQRARPAQATSTGFGQGGSSFPSEHAAAAWSIASVFAHEYPGPATKLLAYGAASALTASRVVGRKHFASDAFIGSTLGWWFGRQVWRQHRDPEADLARWGTFTRGEGEAARDPSSMGSPYVPLDSWVYPAFDRLAALGYVQTAFAGMRPWTRMECARLVEEAGDELDSAPETAEAASIYAALQREYAREIALAGGAQRNVSFVLDSVYSRVEVISGQPLRDGYHFAQTRYNDYGRPYGEGFNLATGVQIRAAAGPLVFYARGEYQRSPAAAGYSPQQAATIAPADLPGTSLPAVPFPATSRVRLLDAYVGLMLHNTEISFGQQSLWWGPARGSSMIFSNNAEPIPMLRVNHTSPGKLPSILGWLGPARAEFILGRLQGHRFIFTDPGTGVRVLFGPDVVSENQPWIQGQKISFKPTPNFEFSVGRTGVFGDPIHGLSMRTLGRSLFSHSNALPGAAADPGDRRSSFDFSYRIPKLRDRLILYADSFAEDEYSPIAYPRRSAFIPGIYLPRLPGLPRAELRIEGVYTNLSGLRNPGYFYGNGKYPNGYTNYGNIIGSWVGRQGHGMQAWATYWLSSASRLQVAYRAQRVDKSFLQGGSVTDLSGTADLLISARLRLSAYAQYERWRFPLLSAGRQTNVTTAVQLTYRPNWGWN